MKILLVLLSVTFMSCAMADNNCDAHCQSKLINQYYEKINQAVLQNSTPAHVDDFLRILHDDVIYLHEEYEAEFDKDSWKKAFLRQMERGSYAATIASNTLVTSTIHGYQTAAVEFVSRYRNEQDTKHNTSPKRLAIFKFKDKKIVSIQDHWYHIAEQAQ